PAGREAHHALVLLRDEGHAPARLVPQPLRPPGDEGGLLHRVEEVLRDHPLVGRPPALDLYTRDPLGVLEAGRPDHPRRILRRCPSPGTPTLPSWFSGQGYGCDAR